MTSWPTTLRCGALCGLALLLCTDARSDEALRERIHREYKHQSYMLVESPAGWRLYLFSAGAEPVRSIDVEPGDPLLRDRGYFIVGTVRDLKEKGVDTVSRYKHKTNIYDVETGKEINLLEYLGKYGSIDREVLVGKEKYKVKITARPVDEETANLRRMKAKKESRSKKPSKELLALMSWTVFVTTVEIEELPFETIFKLYGLRWRIENIFKTWKSHFSFDKIHGVSEKQLRILLTARLTMIVLIYHRLFRPLSELIKKISEKRLSLMKFTNHIRKNLEFIYELLDFQNISEKTVNIAIRYCTYDSRKRKNFETRLEQIIMDIGRK